MAVELNVLPPQGQSYIVAGALLSIALSPLFFSLAGRLRPLEWCSNAGR